MSIAVTIGALTLTARYVSSTSLFPRSPLTFTLLFPLVHHEQLDSVLRTLDAQLQKRDGEVKALKAKYGAITERAAGQQGAAAGQRKESQGVLA